MQKVTVQTSHNVAIDYPLASVGERIGAYLIDLFIIFAYLMLASALFGFVMKELEYDSSLKMVFVVFFFYGPVLFYDLIFEVLMNGQSLGKRALDIKVIQADGGAPTLGSYFLRWLFRLLEASFFPMMGAIAITSIVVAGKGQRLGDMAAGTCVVKTRIPRRKFKLYVHSASEGYTPGFPQVLQLSDHDVDMLREVLWVYNRYGNYEPVTAASERVQALLHLRVDMSHLDFLEEVVRDYTRLTAVVK